MIDNLVVRLVKQQFLRCFNDGKRRTQLVRRILNELGLLVPRLQHRPKRATCKNVTKCRRNNKRNQKSADKRIGNRLKNCNFRIDIRKHLHVGHVSAVTQKRNRNATKMVPVATKRIGVRARIRIEWQLRYILGKNGIKADSVKHGALSIAHYKQQTRVVLDGVLGGAYDASEQKVLLKNLLHTRIATRASFALFCAAAIIVA